MESVDNKDEVLISCLIRWQLGYCTQQLPYQVATKTRHSAVASLSGNKDKALNSCLIKWHER